MPRQWFAEARLAADFSQEALARVLLTSVRQVQRWEHGTSTPIPAHIRLIGKTLGEDIAKRLRAERAQRLRSRRSA